VAVAADPGAYYNNDSSGITELATMKTISLKLPSRLDHQLARAAKQRRQSKSEVVRTALAQFLNGAKAVPPGSALEAAMPWIGCVEGPGDLATNPKYMEDFGK
jgi:hypothetical protein